MKLEVAKNGEVAILRLRGDLMGGPDAVKIHDEVKREIGEGTVKFLIDLMEVPHMSSSGLGALISCRASISKSGGTIKLLKPAARIQEVLRITDLIRYFDCYNEEQEALEAFAGS